MILVKFISSLDVLVMDWPLNVVFKYMYLVYIDR